MDNTGIHPESYSITKDTLIIIHPPEKEPGIEEAVGKLTRLSMEKLAESLSVGEKASADILVRLTKPGRDMHDEMPAPLLRIDVLSMEDLKPGMELTGTVHNIIDFGTFVGAGAKQGGLVHISELSKKSVKHSADVVSAGDIVTVWIG